MIGYVDLRHGTVQEVDYTPSGAVLAGDVVVANSVAYFAQRPIAASALGSLAVSGGVWRGVRSSGAGAFTGGASLYWDASNSVFTTSSTSGGTNTFVGYVVPGGSAASTTYVDFVKQNHVP